MGQGSAGEVNVVRRTNPKPHSHLHVTRWRRTVSSARVSLGVTAAALALLAGCTADGSSGDLETLIDERVAAALLEQAASTTTEAAVNIEALIEERVEAVIEEQVEADLDARPTWAELSVQFACHDALDDLEQQVQRYDFGFWLDDDLGSGYSLWQLTTSELSDDGKFEQDLEAERICAAARRVGTPRGYLALSERLDRLQEPTGFFIRIYSMCLDNGVFDFGDLGSEGRAESLSRRLCEKMLARFHN